MYKGQMQFLIWLLEQMQFVISLLGQIPSVSEEQYKYVSAEVGSRSSKANSQYCSQNSFNCEHWIIVNEQHALMV